MVGGGWTDLEAVTGVVGLNQGDTGHGQERQGGGVGGPGMQWIWWLDLGVGLREKLRWDPHVLCMAG